MSVGLDVGRKLPAVDTVRVEDPNGDALREMVDSAPPHLRSILLCLADGKIRYLVLARSLSGREVVFDFGREGRPWIAIVDDDQPDAEGGSAGPDAYSKELLDYVADAAASFVIVSCKPLVQVYEAAIFSALLKGACMLVETRMEHEADWKDFIDRHGAPKKPSLLALVKTEGRA